MSHLPIVMAAPNGARKTKADHPNLPITIAETVAEAGRCFEAGASILHAHIRDDDGTHSLDSNTYDKLIRKLNQFEKSYLKNKFYFNVGKILKETKEEIVGDERFIIKKKIKIIDTKVLFENNDDLFIKHVD